MLKTIFWINHNTILKQESKFSFIYDGFKNKLFDNFIIIFFSYKILY